MEAFQVFQAFSESFVVTILIPQDHNLQHLEGAHAFLLDSRDFCGFCDESGLYPFEEECCCLTAKKPEVSGVHAGFKSSAASANED